MKMLRSVPAVLFVLWIVAGAAYAAPLPGGSLNPESIPKYVIPLVIPPVMQDNGVANKYNIAVRQFQQQILPGGIWNTLSGRTDAFPATTVWSYGPDNNVLPDSAALGGGVGIAPAPNSQFNYPAYTIETTSGTAVNVRWINDLKENFGAGPNFLPHLLPIDQTLHWANPPSTGCMMGEANRTNCATDNAAFYTGPVPIIIHVHGAHVDPHSDGYAEAWYLPAAGNIPAGYSMSGSMFDDATGTNPGNLGYADFYYRNDNKANTDWYHDHALGMTRSNVYAGPAGFWLVRGGLYDNATVGSGGPAAVLPGPAAVAGDNVLALNTLLPGSIRNTIREIPIAIQDRSFNDNGSLFYPDNRAFFEGVTPEELPIPFAPTSDVAPIWNPEAFFNTMVVNGTTWPQLSVAPAFYRFRLLNGCNSRMLNLSLCVVNPLTDNCYVPTIELPFYQIGAEQGFLSEVVQVMTGYATPLPGNGFIPLPVPAVGGPTQALLMGNAERADVIVDFTGLDNGTKIRMINTGADSPFGGFPVGLAVAHDNTTGQVMQFVVDNTVLQPSDADTTFPEDLVLSKEPALPAATRIRQVSLNEEVSGDFDPAKRVCVCADEFETFAVPIDPVACTADPVAVCPTGFQNIFAFGPVAAKVGVVDLSNPALPAGIALAWEDTSGTSVPVQVTMADNVTKRTVNVTENPRIVGGVFPVEQWEIYNFTVDAHPIHLHLVEFEVVSRSAIPGQALISGGVSPTENGFKDTVIAYPGEITTVKAKFDIPGLYVWHCHIVEHEDNEMMRPFVVSDSPKRSMLDFDDDGKTDLAVFRPSIGQWWIINSRDGGVTTKDWGAPGDVTVPGDYDGDWKTDVAVYRPSSGQWLIINSSTGLTTTKDWGAPGDTPAPGDYDGDGKTDVAVYRPSSGQWFIVNSSTGLTTTKDWGASGDVTVPGDYDGDGKTDVAVYRPSSGQWFIINSSTGLTTTKDWGAPGDVPVKSLY